MLAALGIGLHPSSFWAAIAHGALHFLPVLAVTVIDGGWWVRLFARLRNRPTAEGLVVIALLFALVLPPSIPLWQVALGISFAIVVGKEIFGGTGKNFLNTALTGLAFLYVTYPKEMVMALPPGETIELHAGSYIQIACPPNRALRGFRHRVRVSRRLGPARLVAVRGRGGRAHDPRLFPGRLSARE